LTKAIVIAGMPLSGGAVFPMLRSDNIVRRVEVGIGEPLFVAVNSLIAGLPESSAASKDEIGQR
jgi:hypothetical protein